MLFLKIKAPSRNGTFLNFFNPYTADNEYVYPSFDSLFAGAIAPSTDKIIFRTRIKFATNGILNFAFRLSQLSVATF